jgi:hypothetical protein
MHTVENPHAGQGMVVLDIGGDIGALVVLAPVDLAGLELEICPAGARGRTPDEGVGWWQGGWRHSNDAPGHGHEHGHPPEPAWPHVAVIARPTPEGIQHSAVYPGLRRGRYDVWVRPDGPIALTVRVEGGRVCTAALPAVVERHRRP